MAAVLAGASAYSAALDGGVTTDEWGVVIGAALVAFVGVWGVPNTKETTDGPEA